jgi:alanyl-tRNA synthetase
LRNNHTATHILNYALLDTIGSGVDQKGSLVAPEKLRFDFTAKSALSVDQLKKVENITNTVIKKNEKVYYKDVPLSLAKSIAGVRAVFGEVYPDPVRVVSVGFDIDEILTDPSNPKWASSSLEFCGGTHVAQTSDIKRFAIIEEGSISKGVRRIVGVTGEEASSFERVADEYAKKISALEKWSGTELEKSIKVLAKDFDVAVLPVIRKHELREKFNAIKKKFADEDKLRKAEESKKVGLILFFCTII